MSTQRERVLTALRHAGPTGLTQVDWFAPNVCDHGPPITRLAARINELRDEGHTITSSGTRCGCAVYVLRESFSAGPGESGRVPLVADAGPAETPPTALFDPVDVHRPLSPYDAEAEAA